MSIQLVNTPAQLFSSVWSGRMRSDVVFVVSGGDGEERAHHSAGDGEISSDQAAV